MPHCLSEQIVKRGKTRRGIQRYLCQNIACTQGSFLLDYHNRGCLPEVKHQIIDMSLNASGICDTARVLTNQYRYGALCAQEESSRTGVGQLGPAPYAEPPMR